MSFPGRRYDSRVILIAAVALADLGIQVHLLKNLVMRLRPLPWYGRPVRASLQHPVVVNTVLCPAMQLPCLLPGALCRRVKRQKTGF